MKGGDRPDTIRKWLELAVRQPDPKKRMDLTLLTLTLASAAGRRELWQQELEGWEMNEAPFLVEMLQQALERAMQRERTGMEHERAGMQRERAEMQRERAEMQRERATWRVREETLRNSQVEAILFHLRTSYPTLTTESVTDRIRRQMDSEALGRLLALLTDKAPEDAVARELRG